MLTQFTLKLKKRANTWDVSKDYLQIRFKTLLEENKIKYKTVSNLNLCHANEETIEIELAGSVQYLESCCFKVPNFETATSNKKIYKKCNPHSQLFYTSRT